MSPGAVVALAVLALSGLAMWFGSRTAASQRRARFLDREVLTPADFCRRYYPEEASLHPSAAEALDRTERAFGISQGRLRPGDRFDLELAPVKGWEFGDESNELIRELEASGWTGGRIETVDDFIRTIARLELGDSDDRRAMVEIDAVQRPDRLPNPPCG